MKEPLQGGREDRRALLSFLFIFWPILLPKKVDIKPLQAAPSYLPQHSPNSPAQAASPASGLARGRWERKGRVSLPGSPSLCLIKCGLLLLFLTFCLFESSHPPHPEEGEGAGGSAQNPLPSQKEASPGWEGPEGGCWIGVGEEEVSGARQCFRTNHAGRGRAGIQSQKGSSGLGAFFPES